VVGEVPKPILKAPEAAIETLLVQLVDAKRRDTEFQPAALDEAIQRRIDETPVRKELTEEFGLWVTIIVARPVRLTDRTGSVYGWMDYFEGMELNKRHHKEISRHLDVASVLVAAALGDVTLDEIVFSASGPYYVASGRGPCRVPGELVEPTISSQSRDWEQLPFARIANVLGQGKNLEEKRREALESSSRWLWAAHQDRDPLRGFFFAFFGLEVLAGKMAKNLKDRLVAKLEGLSETLPIHQLLWPSRSEQDYPERNLVFRFAVMASVLSPDTASADVGQFRVLARKRNDIAHGGGEDLHGLPVQECIELLARFLKLASIQDQSL
jgi:hypothetical protein